MRPPGASNGRPPPATHVRRKPVLSCSAFARHAGAAGAGFRHPARRESERHEAFRSLYLDRSLPRRLRVLEMYHCCANCCWAAEFPVNIRQVLGSRRLMLSGRRWSQRHHPRFEAINFDNKAAPRRPLAGWRRRPVLPDNCRPPFGTMQPRRIAATSVVYPPSTGHAACATKATAVSAFATAFTRTQKPGNRPSLPGPMTARPGLAVGD